MSASSSTTTTTTAPATTMMRPEPASDAQPPSPTPTTTQPPTSFLAAPSPSPSPRRRRRRRVRRPAANSLYDLLHQHAGTSLFVRPICWTDLHARVLGARFRQLPPCDRPLPSSSVAGSPPSRGHMQPSRAITTLSDALSEVLAPSAAHPVRAASAVRTVLATLWPDALGQAQFLPDFGLVFGGTVYRDAVRAQVLWNFPSETPRGSLSSFRSVSTRPAESFGGASHASTPEAHCPVGLPMMCYIGKAQLASIRRNLFRVAAGPGPGGNEPVSRLQQLRAKMLVPADGDHDAHFVGVLLGMAQRHFYGVHARSPRGASQWTPPRGGPACPRFEDVKLRILTHDTDTAEFIVYTGYVTASFLKRFHDPFKAPLNVDEDDRVPGIRIEYTRVPIWPILGLRERLGKALGHDVVGDFDPEEIETWEEGVEKGDKGGKRKREALSEVFNGSFEEESDGETALGEKKRCLSRGSEVEVAV